MTAAVTSVRGYRACALVVEKRDVLRPGNPDHHAQARARRLVEDGETGGGIGANRVDSVARASTRSPRRPDSREGTGRRMRRVRTCRRTLLLERTSLLQRTGTFPQTQRDLTPYVVFVSAVEPFTRVARCRQGHALLPSSADRSGARNMPDAKRRNFVHLGDSCGRARHLASARSSKDSIAESSLGSAVFRMARVRLQNSTVPDRSSRRDEIASADSRSSAIDCRRTSAGPAPG